VLDFLPYCSMHAFLVRQLIASLYFSFLCGRRPGVGETFAPVDIFGAVTFICVCFVIYRFCSLHSERCMRLFVPKNNERMITKTKEKRKKKDKMML